MKHSFGGLWDTTRCWMNGLEPRAGSILKARSTPKNGDLRIGLKGESGNSCIFSRVKKYSAYVGACSLSLSDVEQPTLELSVEALENAASLRGA